MHRPAPAAGLVPSLPTALRSMRRRLPTPRGLVKAGSIVATVLGLLWAIVAYSPLAHPRELEVEGVTGVSAPRIKALLEETARGQSTFHVSRSALMAAVTDFPEVAAVVPHPHPPFRLDLEVVMRPPVARANLGGRIFTVAGDGTILQRAGSASVPTIDATVSGLRLDAATVRGGGGALTVLAAAPEPLLALARTIRRGTSGLEVEMQRGPRLIFGNGQGAKDKWAAAAAVIAESSAAARATYIDLRVPGRPAVGGVGGSRSAGTTDREPPSLTAGGSTGDGTLDTAAGAPGGAAATSVAAQAPAPSSASAQSSPATASSANGAATSATANPSAATPTPGAVVSPGAGTAAPGPSSGGGASLTGGATP